MAVIIDELMPDTAFPESSAPGNIWSDDLEGRETSAEDREAYRQEVTRQDEAVLDFLQCSGQASRLLLPLPQRWGLSGPVTLPKLK